MQIPTRFHTKKRLRLTKKVKKLFRCLYLSLELDNFVGKLTTNDMLHNPSFNNLPPRLLDPTTGEMMDTIRILREFENTRTCQRTEIVHREEMHIVLIDLVLTIDNKPAGNHEASGWMSIICSLIGTCKEHNVNPRMYLNDVIAKMPYLTANPLKSPTKSQVRQLLPHVWIQSHPEAKLDASNQ